MKALLQRVTGASVNIKGETVGKIGRGQVVFIGIAEGDTEQDIDYLANKLLNLRVFTDENGRFNRSVKEVGGELLLVSQFTLLADTRKGRRPSFAGAAPPEEASRLFMAVEIHNDGPVTMMLDSRRK